MVLLLSLVLCGEADGASALIDRIRNAWQDSRVLNASIEIRRTGLGEDGERRQVALDSLAVNWSGELWKYETRQAANRLDIQGYSGRRAWRLMEDGDSRPAGFLYASRDDPIPPGDVSDPLCLSCMFRGKPIWLFKSGPAPAATTSDGLPGAQGLVIDFAHPRPALLNRVQLVITKEDAKLPQHLKAYDLLVYEQDELVCGISLSQEGTSFDRMDYFDGAGRVVMTTRVLRRDLASGLPMEWSCDVVSPVGSWRYGYRATVTSWSQKPLPVAAFAPKFPADALVFERETGITIDRMDLPELRDIESRLGAAFSSEPQSVGSLTESHVDIASRPQPPDRLPSGPVDSAKADRNLMAGKQWWIVLVSAAAIVTTVIWAMAARRRRRSA